MDEQQEWTALELVAPGLGVRFDTVRKIKPQNDSEYPGLTFDFAASRHDGTKVAIEVTNAWDERWLRAQATLNRLAKRLTPELALAGCSSTHYSLSAVGPDRVPTSIGHIRLDQLARLAAMLDPHTEVETEYGFDIRNWGSKADKPKAFGSVTSAEFMEGGESKERFRYAVETCTHKLEEAANFGLESCLVIVHWMLGSTRAFELALEEMVLGEHPQQIWVVDLGGWPNREPTERLR